MRDHEIIHREFFKAILSANGIPQLTFDFSLVDFNSRDSVLTNSQNMEDTGVSAYNGILPFAPPSPRNRFRLLF